MQVRVFAQSAGTFAPVSYCLDADWITDPIGVTEADTTGSPHGGTAGGSPPPSNPGPSNFWTAITSAGNCEWF